MTHFKMAYMYVEACIWNDVYLDVDFMKKMSKDIITKFSDWEDLLKENI